MIGRVLRSSLHGKRTSQIANDFYEAGQHTLSSKSCGSASGRKNPCDDEPLLKNLQYSPIRFRLSTSTTSDGQFSSRPRHNPFHFFHQAKLQ